MAHINHPLIGDATYAARTRLSKGIGAQLRETLLSFTRQALHARKLGLIHPHTEEWLEWETDLPADFLELLSSLAAEEDYCPYKVDAMTDNPCPNNVGIDYTTKEGG